MKTPQESKLLFTMWVFLLLTTFFAACVSPAAPTPTLTPMPLFTPRCPYSPPARPEQITSDNAARVRLAYTRARLNSDPLHYRAISPNFAVIATGLRDGTVLLWGVTRGSHPDYPGISVPIEGQLLTTLRGHTDAVFGVAFGFDGKELYSTSLDGTTSVWQVCTPPN